MMYTLSSRTSLIKELCQGHAFTLGQGTISYWEGLDKVKLFITHSDNEDKIAFEPADLKLIGVYYSNGVSSLYISSDNNLYEWFSFFTVYKQFRYDNGYFLGTLSVNNKNYSRTIKMGCSVTTQNVVHDLTGYEITGYVYALHK